MNIPCELIQFENFLNRKLQNIRCLKHGLIITIYGSYCPSEEKERLIKLKNFLISEGYESTRLVEDYPENIEKYCLSRSSEERMSLKSECCLEFSDVNFLVFTHKGKCQGVSIELAYCRNSPTMLDRRWRCVIFDEIINNCPATSFMDRGAVYFATGKMKRVEFRNDNELLDLARRTAVEFLYSLHPHLEQRCRFSTLQV